MLTDPQFISVVYVLGLGYSQEEIAFVLGCTKKVVNVHISRGIKRIIVFLAVFCFCLSGCGSPTDLLRGIDLPFVDFDSEEDSYASSEEETEETSPKTGESNIFVYGLGGAGVFAVIMLFSARKLRRES